MKQSSRIQMTGVGVLAGALMMLAVTAADAASATNVLFDFTRTSGDRQHHFEQHHPGGGFDDNSTYTRWQVQGTGIMHAQRNTGTAWIILNDPEPDTSNGTPPSGQDVLMASQVTLRTRVAALSSGTAEQPGTVGFLVGLNSTNSATADGFIFAVDRTPGGSGDDNLHVDTFVDGARAANLATGTGHHWNSQTDVHFLELVLSGAGAYDLKLFDDADISGTGNDTNRLLSADFGTASPQTSLSGTLSGYAAGWVGVYFEDDPGGAANGGARLGNFYGGLAILPVGTVVSVK